MAVERANREQPSARQVARALTDVLASTRTAVVLLLGLALASVVGTILPDPTAQKYVYGRLWFHLLLGLLGLNLLVCTVWRRRIGMARIWSLLSHGGILLVLVGAMVTLILAERGAITIREGQELAAFIPAGRAFGSVTSGRHRKPEPLGFTLRLIDFRITHYPTVDYVYLMRRGRKPVRLKVRSGEPLDIPGTEWRLTGMAFMPKGDGSFVEVAMPRGKTRLVPAKVGSTQGIGDKALAIKILRYEPSFKIDVKTKKVTSDNVRPVNPALKVALVRDGKEDRPRWLFAKVPSFGHMGHGSKKPEKIKLRFLHPSVPLLVAVAERAHASDGKSGAYRRRAEPPPGTARKHFPLRLTQGQGVPSPWDPNVTIVYTRAPSRVKEYESEVEVLEEGRVVRRHVIRVNSPLVHKGTQLSQVGFDKKGLRWSRLGVSRDRGVWFVYAGFLATTLGLIGKFYVGPLSRSVRTAIFEAAPLSDRSAARDRRAFEGCGRNERSGIEPVNHNIRRPGG